MLKLRGLLVLIVIGFLTLVASVSTDAQESTPEVTPEITIESPTVVPTEAPTATPVAETTPDATVEPPTPEATVEPATPEQTVEPPTPEQTGEPPTLPTATPPTPSLPSELVLSLLVRDLFDTGDSSAWVYGTNWMPAANETGLGLQTVAADGLQLQGGPFRNAAAQISLKLTGGSVHLGLHQSAVGSYSAALDAAGLVTLYRAGVPVQSAPLALPPEAWHTLRLSVIAGVLRVTVNNTEMLVWFDDAPLPPGTASITVYPPPDGSAFTVQLDNFFLWVPEAELSLYPSPTPIPPTSIPEQPTLPPTPEPTSSVTPEPTAEVTIAPTSEPTAEITTEPPAEITTEPTPEATPLLDPITGKSLVAVQYVPPIGAQSTDHNQPPGARVVPQTLPFYDVDNTDNNDTTGEANLGLTCGFNITATVWYRFAPQVTKQVIISAAGSVFDTILAVYPDSGGAPAQLPTNPVGCNDDASATNLTSKLTLTLTAGQTYWIRLGGYNGEHGAYQLAVQEAVLAVPNPPRLSSPANNTTTSVTNHTFQWTAPTTGGAPAHYDIQIGTTSTFTTLVHSDIVPTPQTTYPRTLSDGVYYWRVRSMNANFVGGSWAAAWKLTVDTIDPDAPLLTAPLDTATLTLPRPTLSWNTVTGANRYRVTLAEQGGATLLTAYETTTTSLALGTTVLAQALQHGKTYDWNVVALDAANNESLASDTWRFTINLMNALMDGAAVVAADGRPTFTWFAAGFTGAQYVLEVNTTSDFSGGVAYTSPALTTTSYKITGALPTATPPRYYWRLSVLNHPGTLPSTLPVRSFVVTTAIPPSVTLLTPINLKVLKDDPVPLSWRALADTLPRSPFTYQVQIGTDKTFVSGIVYDQTTAAGVATTDVPGLTLGVHFWRVRPINTDTAPGKWSAVWSFTVDRTGANAPTLRSPANTSFTNLVRPTLSWNASPTAVAYYVTLSENGGGTLVNNRRVTTTALALSTTVLGATPLKHGKTYSWNVTAEDVAGNTSNPSDTWEFTINLMNAPADNVGVRVTAFPGSPSFTWYTAGLTGISYKVEVSTSSTNWSAAKSCTNSALSCMLAGDQRLPGSATYYWRLLVLVGGTPQHTAVPVRSFVVSTTLPGTPTLSSPVTGAAFNAPPTLKWTGPSGTFDHFELQVSSNNTFTPPLAHIAAIPLGTTTYSGLPVLADGTYWWRVRAVNSGGAGGGWSASRSFIIDTSAPTGDALKPTLLTPANRSSYTGPLPRFTWKALTGYRRYEIQLITSGDFATPPPLGFAVATTSFTPSGPLLYTSYRWRVRVLDAAGNGGPWSDVFEVKTVSATTAVPVLNRFETSTPTLTWTPISWAKAYEVQVSYNSAFTVLLPGVPLVTSTPPPTEITLPALPNGTYYWRVRAQRQDNTWGTWSNGTPGTFQIDN